MSESEPTFFTTLGGAVVEVPKRGKHYVEPSGHASPPGTGPEGETCGSCEHVARVESGSRKVFFKCGLLRPKWTHGRRSDVLKSSPACRLWQSPVPGL